MIWQKDKKYGLAWQYHINQTNIHLARDLVSLLELFYEETLQVSTHGSACLTNVIVFIDEITKHLSNAIKGSGKKYLPALQNACRFGLQLTNKYYTLTDCLPLYQIAMVLHPSFKDKYFQIAGWERDWIIKAVWLTHEIIECFYKPETELLMSSQPTKSIKPKTGNIAQLAMAAQTQSSSDPIDIWLSCGLLLNDGSCINCCRVGWTNSTFGVWRA